MSIVLSMIVKDEESIIVRCLDSVKSIVDFYCICDTGSSDKTVEVIAAWLYHNGKRGVVHQHEWVNFGHNRELSLRLARQEGDRVLWIDADDTLVVQEGVSFTDNEQSAYLICHNRLGVETWKPNLVKSTDEWHWHGPVHEFLAPCIKQPAMRMSPSVLRIDTGYGGARAKDPNRFINDIALLDGHLKDHPDDVTAMFHLALSYVHNMDYKTSIRKFEDVVNHPNSSNEYVWASLYSQAMASDMLYTGSNHNLASQAYIRCINFDPSRIEPAVALAGNLRGQGRLHLAYEIAKNGLSQPESNGTMFVEPDARVKLVEIFAGICFDMGKYKECSDVLLELSKLKGEVNQND